MQIRVRVIRPLLFKGTSYAVGETIRADALGAGELIASGRAVLADGADAPRVRAAVVEQRDRMMRQLDAAARHLASPHDPWQKIGNF